MEKAGRKWLASKQWREENDIGACCAYVGVGVCGVCHMDPRETRAHRTTHLSLSCRAQTDHILEAPHPNFDVLKQVYPAFIHGRDLQGNAISVEQPGAFACVCVCVDKFYVCVICFVGG